MQKIFSLLLISLLIGSSGFANTAIAADSANPQSVMLQKNNREQMRKEFEQRLNLTDKQKEKAKQLHQQGREEIRPVIMKIEVKRQEIETIKLSRMADRMQQEKIAEINAEIKELEKQAQEIRKKNTQEFEKLLNKKQKAELEKMKAEGRLKFEQKHPARTPFQGLGTPNFLLRPILPAPNRHE
ncbi:MAG: hypothetical protein NC191_05555 [Muribaculaceae bacterium]|nr:hypothetical protein [Muribaculaceae bacterium]